MSSATPIYIPRENVNDESVTVLRWLADDGAQVSAGDIVAEVETSKTNLDIEVSASGYLRHRYAEGDEAPIGAAICYISETADAPLPEESSPASAALVSEEPRASAAQISAEATAAVAGVRFSAAARALMAEKNIDAAAFAGRGFVRTDDVQAYLGGSVAPVVAAPESPKQAASIVEGVAIRREPLSRQKRIEAKYLSAGQRDALLSHVTMPCATRGLRRLTASQDRLRGIPAPLFIHEAARLLRAYPQFNACHDDGHVVYYESVNIGYAIDGEHGLKVPVIRDADTKDLAAIAEELETHIFAYVEDKMDVAELAHGTFTITDLSGEGASAMHPLINQGQSAILGIGAEVKAPHAAEGLYNLILSFDHHLSEGRAAAQFLGELRTRIRGHEDALAQQAAQGSDGPACSVCRRSVKALPPRVYLLQRYDAAGNTSPICSLCAQGFS